MSDISDDSPEITGFITLGRGRSGRDRRRNIVLPNVRDPLDLEVQSGSSDSFFIEDEPKTPDPEDVYLFKEQERQMLESASPLSDESVQSIVVSPPRRRRSTLSEDLDLRRSTLASMESFTNDGNWFDTPPPSSEDSNAPEVNWWDTETQDLNRRALSSLGSSDSEIVQVRRRLVLNRLGFEIFDEHTQNDSINNRNRGGGGGALITPVSFPTSTQLEGGMQSIMVLSPESLSTSIHISHIDRIEDIIIPNMNIEEKGDIVHSVLMKSIIVLDSIMIKLEIQTKRKTSMVGVTNFVRYKNIDTKENDLKVFLINQLTPIQHTIQRLLGYEVLMNIVNVIQQWTVNSKLVASGNTFTLRIPADSGYNTVRKQRLVVYKEVERIYEYMDVVKGPTFDAVRLNVKMHQSISSFIERANNNEIYIGVTLQSFTYKRREVKPKLNGHPNFYILQLHAIVPEHNVLNRAIVMGTRFGFFKYDSTIMTITIEKSTVVTKAQISTLSKMR